MSINSNQLEAALAGFALGNGIQHGQSCDPNCNKTCYGQEYLYDSYFFVCEECVSWCKILAWALGGLLLGGLIIGGIVALALIPVYINGGNNNNGRTVLAGPRGLVNSQSALGNSLVTTTDAGTLTFWNAETDQLIRTFTPGSTTAIEQISPGKVVALDSDQTVSFWNSNGLINQVKLNQFGISNDLFVKSANEIYVGTSSGRLLILDANGKIVQNLQNTGGASIDFFTKLSNGDIVTLDANKKISTWRNNAILRSFDVSSTSGSISNFATSDELATESLIYSIGSTLYEINAANGQLLKSFQVPGTISDLLALKNGDVAVASGKTIYYYDLNTGNQIKASDTLENTITSLTSNIENIYVGSKTGDIISLDNIQSNTVDNTKTLPGPPGVVENMSALGNSLVTTTDAGTLTFWNAETNQIIKTFTTGAIVSLYQISPGNVVTISADQTVTFWNSNGPINQVILNQFGLLNDLYVKDSNEIYVTTSTGRLIVLDSTGKIVQNLQNTGGFVVTEISQLSNGDILTIDSNRVINIWRNNEIINTFSASSDPGTISNLAVSNGLTVESILYTIGSTLYVVNAENGQLIRSFEVSGTITDIIALKSGGVAVAAGKNIYYYDLNTGNQLKASDTLDYQISSLSLNGNNIYAGSNTGVISNLNYTPANVDNNIKQISGPSGTISILSVFENSLVTTTSAGTLTFWDSNTFQIINTFTPGSITLLKQISADNLVSITADQIFTFWNAKFPTNQITINQFGLFNDLYAKSENEIYVGTSSGRLLILDSKGDVIQNLENNGAASIIYITQLSNGDIFTVDTNKNINTWRNNEIVNTFAASSDPGQISNFATSNGLATESIVYTIESKIYIVNPANGQLIQSFEIPAFITNMEILKNGAVALSSGRNVYYYSLETGNKIRSLDTLDYSITGLTSNANFLYAGSNIGDIFVLDPYTGSNFNAKKI